MHLAGPDLGQCDRLAVGDRVGVPWLGHTCGQCDYCRDHRENLCDAPGFTGMVDYIEFEGVPIIDEDASFEPVNVAPEASDDTFYTEQDTTIVLTAEDLLANDSDIDGPGPLTITVVTDGTLGTVVDNGDGTVTYTSTSGAGPDSFSYTISDGDLTATATVELDVLTEPNAAPEATAARSMSPVDN